MHGKNIAEAVGLFLLPFAGIAVGLVYGSRLFKKMPKGDRKKLEQRLYAGSAFHPDNLPRISDNRIG